MIGTQKQSDILMEISLLESKIKFSKMFKDDDSNPKSLRDMHASRYLGYLNDIISLKKKVRNINLKEMFPDNESDVTYRNGSLGDYGLLKDLHNSNKYEDNEYEDNAKEDNEYEDNAEEDNWCEIREELDLSGSNRRKSFEIFNTLYPDGIEE